eukprot:gene646-10350_t
MVFKGNPYTKSGSCRVVDAPCENAHQSEDDEEKNRSSPNQNFTKVTRRKKLGLDEGGIQTTVTQIRTKEKEQKKSRKRNKKTKEVPDGKGQPCNSNENAAASEPNDDSKVQPDNSLQNGEQEEDIVEDNEDGNVNDTTESKTVPKEKNTKHDT